MKLLAGVEPKNEALHIQILQLKSEQAQYRVIIAQSAARMRANRLELLKLTNKGPKNAEK